MTRETKIGLLVGLAFIIVIGILLSDHVKSTTEPIPAALPQAADFVREGVRAPGAADESSTYTTTVVNPRQPVTPRQPVPTQVELTAPRPTESEVSVRGPSGGQPPVVIRRTNNTPAPTSPIASDIPSPNAPQPTDNPAPDNRGNGNIPDALADAARSHGEALVSTDPARAAATARKYTAEAGDTLSHMAARFMGANTKANRDAIVRANPSLTQNPDRIIVGHSYVIPTPETASAAPAPSPAPAPTAPAPTEVAAAQPGYWYTVKPGDNLWSIAADQLGSGTASAAIKDLNKDVLKGGDAVRPNMRLRLPAKPIASAN